MSLGTPCSVQSLAVGEALAGTAPIARTWVVVEQMGPWGRDALTESRLDEPVKQALRDLKAAGAGVLLARHPDRPDPATHHVFVARSAAGGLLLREGVLDDLGELTRWDPEAVAAGHLPAVGRVSNEPLLLVCTHSRRDACCAVHGRALVGGILDRAPDHLRSRVWECSHIGGHRFAPVTLSLPIGAVHGRCSVDDGLAVLDLLTADRVLPSHLRGRSCFPPPLQAAEAAVRFSIGEDAADALDVLVVHGERATPVDPKWAPAGHEVDVEIRHVDGRAWRAGVSRASDDVMRAESCGKDPLPVHTWVVHDLSPAPAWA